MIAPDPTEEHVLAVPVNAIRRAGLLHRGFREGGIETALGLVEAEGRFLPRRAAEEDLAWKQIIPYVLVACGSQVFLLRRGGRGGEPRLHDKLSIGVGGHVRREAESPSDWVAAGLRRELDEELVVRAPYLVVPLGTLNDDTNAVGQVHFGLAFRADLERPEAEVRETTVLSGGFVEAAELTAHFEAMESWSRWLVEAIVARPGSVFRRDVVALA